MWAVANFLWTVAKACGLFKFFGLCPSFAGYVKVLWTSGLLSITFKATGVLVSGGKAVTVKGLELGKYVHFTILKSLHSLW